MERKKKDYEAQFQIDPILKDYIGRKCKKKIDKNNDPSQPGLSCQTKVTRPG
jgi:hypothetical protein